MKIDVSLKALLIIITYILISTITNSQGFRVEQCMSINVISDVKPIRDCHSSERTQIREHETHSSTKPNMSLGYLVEIMGLLL